MCMEDVRLGRETGAAPSVIDCPDATATLLLPYNANRFAVLIGLADTDPAVIGPQGMNVAAGRGYLLAAGAEPLKLDIQHHGRMVTMPWYGSGIGAATVIAVTEVFLEKQ